MILLIDLSNMVWSTFYSSLRFNNVEAESCPTSYTGHVDFFHQRLVKTLQDQPCHECIFVLDRKPLHKFKIFSAYKKTRKKISFDPKPAVMDILAEWKSTILYSEYNEADDAIASYIGLNIGKAITVASTDKDLWQVLEFPYIRVYNFHSGNFVTKAELHKAFELEDYAHIKLHKALWGDNSDNVENLIPRMQKQILPLIKLSDGSLRDFWRVFDEKKSSLSAKCIDMLESNKDRIKINYELVRLNYDCKIVLETAKRKEQQQVTDSLDSADMLEVEALTEEIKNCF